MKKIITLLAMVAALTSYGQSFQSRSFIPGNISGIVITNTATSTSGGYTNLNSFGYYAPALATTNAYCLSYTNLSLPYVVSGVNVGTWVICTNAYYSNYSGAPILYVTNDAVQLTQDVPLWSRRDGSMPINVISNSINSASLISDVSLGIRLMSDTGTTPSVTLIFVPVFDGVLEATDAAEALSLTIAANGVTPVQVATNLPVWKWPGCSKIRLKSAFTVSGRAAITSLSINGFVP